jgi:hypothetical protein
MLKRLLSGGIWMDFCAQEHRRDFAHGYGKTKVSGSATQLHGWFVFGNGCGGDVFSLSSRQGNR